MLHLSSFLRLVLVLLRLLPRRCSIFPFSLFLLFIFYQKGTRFSHFSFSCSSSKKLLDFPIFLVVVPKRCSVFPFLLFLLVQARWEEVGVWRVVSCKRVREEEESTKAWRERRVDLSWKWGFKVRVLSRGRLRVASQGVGGGRKEEEERSRGVRAMRLHASPERSYKLRNIDLNKEPPPWDTDDVSGGATGSGGGGDTIAFRGVRHRPELNKWVTEIRPTSQKRKIWLGTYETPQEAARAYDAGIFYTKKKIPYNFEDSPHHLHNQPIPPELPWDAFAALVKQKATLAAKRHRVNNLQEFATAQ